MYNQTQASQFPSLCNNIIDLWKGFGYNDTSTSPATVVNDRGITVPYPVKDVTKYDAMKPYVDKYYNYLSLIEAQPGDTIANAHAKEFTWESDNHKLKYVNDNNNTHHVECSNAACPSTVFKTASKNHKHNNVASTDQCDLCGYRKGMPSGFEYSSFDDSAEKYMNSSTVETYTLSTALKTLVYRCSSGDCFITVNSGYKKNSSQMVQSTGILATGCSGGAYDSVDGVSYSKTKVVLFDGWKAPSVNCIGTIAVACYKKPKGYAAVGIDDRSAYGTTYMPDWLNGKSGGDYSVLSNCGSPCISMRSSLVSGSFTSRAFFDLRSFQNQITAPGWLGLQATCNSSGVHNLMYPPVLYF